MKNLSLELIAKACGGTYHGDQSKLNDCVKGIVIDNRKIEPGFLFVAVRGERVDGHSFVSKALETGAIACLVEEIPEGVTGPCIVVDSTLQAIKEVAEFYRTTLDIQVVGITGSVGKTSTKEMIASVLEQKFRVLKTQGNFNNEIGVPLTIFNIKEEHQVAVLEMGISDFGEMHRLSKMVKPNICVMTNIGLCHLENLKTRDGILQAKSEIYDFASDPCHAILNGDDDKLITLKNRESIHPEFFGMEGNHDITAHNVKDLGLDGTECDLVTKQGTVHVHIPIPGMHMVYNAMAGALVGLALNMSLDEIKAGIEALQPTGGRNNILKVGKRTIIDDCYNANPVSMRASIDVLSKANGRKVALLGDMGELGENEKQLHYEIGEYVAKKGIDCLICVGKLSAQMRDAAMKNSEGMQIAYYETLDALTGQLEDYLQEEDTILVKASHFMQFEKLVDGLKR